MANAIGALSGDHLILVILLVGSVHHVGTRSVLNIPTIPDVVKPMLPETRE
jgi:hypothetical protein